LGVFKVVGIDIDKPSIEDANRLKGKRKTLFIKTNVYQSMLINTMSY